VVSAWGVLHSPTCSRRIPWSMMYTLVGTCEVANSMLLILDWKQSKNTMV